MNTALSLLQQHLHKNRLFHAYLLIGGGAINQKNILDDFGQHYAKKNNVKPEIFEYDFNSQGDLDSLRQLISWTSLSSFGDAVKFVFLQNFHLASTQAGNLLLKTLEEPPKNVIFFLQSDSWQILPTIFSRCITLRINGEEELNEIQQEILKILGDVLQTNVLGLRLLFIDKLEKFESMDLTKALAKLAKDLMQNLNSTTVLNLQQTQTLLSRLQFSFNRKLILQDFLVKIKT